MSTALEPKTEVTPADLLAMPDGKHYELVGGNLVERNVGLYSCIVAVKLSRRLDNYCESHELGWVIDSECGYQCFPDAPGKVRRADVSFIRLDRLSAEQVQAAGFVHIAPDLAVEVSSPHDLVYELNEKIQEYLAAGVRLVWAVNPAMRTVRIQRADGSSLLLREHDELSGEDVLPGFRCRVGELFPDRATEK